MSARAKLAFMFVTVLNLKGTGHPEAPSSVMLLVPLVSTFVLYPERPPSPSLIADTWRVVLKEDHM